MSDWTRAAAERWYDQLRDFYAQRDAARAEYERHFELTRPFREKISAAVKASPKYQAHLERLREGKPRKEMRRIATKRWGRLRADCYPPLVLA